MGGGKWGEGQVQRVHWAAAGKQHSHDPPASTPRPIQQNRRDLFSINSTFCGVLFGSSEIILQIFLKMEI